MRVLIRARVLCMYSSMFGRKLRHVQNKVVRQDRSRMSRSDVCTLRTVAAVQYSMVVNGKNVVRYVYVAVNLHCYDQRPHCNLNVTFLLSLDSLGP